MRNVGEVLAEMLGSEHPPGGASRQRSVELFPEEGVAHLDYGDADHEFRVNVTLVPRRRVAVPRGVVCEIDGVGVRLLEVAISNDVRVVIEGTSGPVYERVLEEFRAAYQSWERLVTEEGMSGHEPPKWPGGRLFGCLRLSDEHGTAYRLSRGEAGGHGNEWTCTHVFRPLPPPEAQQLRLEFTDQGAAVGEVALPPLWDPHPRR